MSRTIEQKTSGAILQKPSAVKIGRRTFLFPRATTGTLIEISSIVSTLPVSDVKDAESENRVISIVLNSAKEYRPIAEAVAVALLGWKRVKRCRRAQMLHLPNRLSWLTSYILDNVTNAELVNIFIRAINMQDIGSFFALTTFLSELRITKQTREVETTTTASGQ